MNSLACIRLALKCFLMFVVLVPLLAGCWDNKDINHRSLPVIMGISLTEENQYKVFLDIPAANETSTVNIVSDTGDTINEIIDHMSMNMETQVDLLHLKIVIVDKNFASKGMEDIISAFNRSRDISSKTLLRSVMKGWINSFRRCRRNRSTAAVSFTIFEKRRLEPPIGGHARMANVSKHSFLYARRDRPDDSLWQIHQYRMRRIGHHQEWQDDGPNRARRNPCCQCLLWKERIRQG